MQLFQWDAQPDRTITDYGSIHAAVAPLVRPSPDVFVVCIRLNAGGVLGYHQAVGDQLFLVVEGEGWVRAEGKERVSISAGQAAFWQAGEWHESGTDSGMTALVIEGTKLNLADLQVLD